MNASRASSFSRALRWTLRGALPLSATAIIATFAQGGARADAPPPKKGEAAPAPQPKANADRWVAATPDDMVDGVIARAKKGGEDALAAIVVAWNLEDRASLGRVRAGLDAIAASSSPIADDAKWLSLRQAPTPASRPWPGSRNVRYDAPPDANGMVKAFRILGPFQDTGGGLMRREGPEAPGQSWTDASATYSWGIYEVAWRRVLPDVATARGIPLDLYVHPRSESCTYLASKVSFPAGSKPVIVNVAASGAVRLSWDGADVAASEDVHPKLVLDRMAAKIDAPAGDHLLGLKLCSGAVADEGRVRVRFTDEQRKEISLTSSSDLSGLAIAPAPAAPQPPAAPPAKGKGKGKTTSNPPAPSPNVLASPIASSKSKDTKKGADDKPAPVANDDKKPGAKGKDKPKKADKPDVKVTAPPVQITPPKGIAVVKTPLQKALEVGTDSPPAQALTAAIVRTFAGAEDNRSPRTPGLLDRVARSPNVTTDDLAMAGWVSPFGANRSGWLNLAHARALKEKDGEVAAFAQRRLVLSHLNTRYVDWAESMANEEPLKSAHDPDALLIHAIIKRQLGGSGVSRASLEDLEKVEAQQQAKTPTAIVGEILDMSRNKEQSLALAKRLADARSESRGLRYAEQYRAIDGATFERAVAENMAHFTSADELIRAGRELLDAGRTAWAREVFYWATKVAPNRSSAFQGLAEARQAVLAAEQRAGQPATEDAKVAVADLSRARDLEPGDSMLKAEIAFRNGLPGDESAGSHEVMADEQYIPKPETFLARGRANPAKKGEIVDRELHWVRVVTYHPDKRVSQLMHYAREIVIEPRTDNDLYENVPSEGDESELLLARVHHKDGTVEMPQEQGSGGRRPFVHWPELKTGDVVEVAVRSWTAGPVGRRGEAPFYFIDYVGSTDTHPILYNEVVVDSPKTSPLAIDVLNGKAEKITSAEKDGRVITRYQWEHPPSVPDEPLAPKLSEILPVVVGSTFNSWNDFREWYRAAVKGFTEPDDQVRRVAADLTKGKKTRDEKLKALFEFVADDIRYVNYVSGEWWLPNRPQELLNRCQGDCDDKAMLLITLLKAIGIDATEVLVQTRYTAQPSLLRSTKAAIPMFDHGIAYLPGKGKEPGIWLDATSPESRLGPLPSMDARTVALFIDEGDAKILDTPASSPAEHGVDADWTLKLSATGAADVTAKETHTGDSAFQLRMALKQADARSQWVEQYLMNGWFSTVQVTGEVGFTTDLPKGIAVLKYQAHADLMARREGQELAVPINELSTLTGSMAPLVKRTLPVVLPPGLAPGHQTHVMKIVAPEGYVFADLPPNGDESGGEFGKGHVEFAKGSNASEVIVKRSVVFDMSEIPVEKYAKWREWLQRVDGLMHRMVRLVPASASAKPPAKAKAK